jgi:hypothetical protein
MKNIHFVHGLHDDGFNICERVAITSAWMNNPDWSVFLWSPEEPTGEQWEKLKAKVPVRVMPIGNPKTWNGSNIPKHQHRADLIRHTVLYAMGGVYADTDTITVAPFPEDWLNHDTVIGREFCYNDPTIGLCNAVMFSQMHSRFQWKWLQKWQEFDGGGWNEISVQYPLKIHQENPGLAKSVDFEMLGFIHCDSNKYWEGIHSLDGCVIAHLWRTYHDEKMRALTEEQILKRENTYCLHASKYL